MAGVLGSCETAEVLNESEVPQRFRFPSECVSCDVGIYDRAFERL